MLFYPELSLINSYVDHKKIEVLQHFDYNKTFYFGKVVPFNRLYALTTLRVCFVEIDTVD